MYPHEVMGGLNEKIIYDNIFKYSLNIHDIRNDS